jgi:hypothetical protein
MSEVYCTICGCSLAGGLIGSTAADALRRRRRIAARNRQARERGEPDPALPYEEDTVWNVEIENQSYDPDLVSEKSLEWTNSSCCLGNDGYAPSGYQSVRLLLFSPDSEFPRRCAADPLLLSRTFITGKAISYDGVS